MIKIQIVERPKAKLFQTLKAEIRSGGLRTLELSRYGKKVTHKNKNIPGWINWKASKGIIQCEGLQPRKPGREWQMTQVLVGRLADSFPRQRSSA